MYSGCCPESTGGALSKVLACVLWQEMQTNAAAGIALLGERDANYRARRYCTEQPLA